MKKLTSVIIALLVAGSVSAQTNSQSAAVAVAFDQPMLAGTSYSVAPCTDFTELFDGTAERKQGKERATQLKLSLLGWSEGYLEGFPTGDGVHSPRMDRQPDRPSSGENRCRT